MGGCIEIWTKYHCLPFHNFLLLFCFLQGVSVEKKVQIAKLSKACADVTKVSPGEVEKLRKSDWSSDDVTVREYIKCIAKKTHMDANGKYQRERYTSALTGPERQMVSDALDKCEKQIGEITLDASWDFAKCYFSLLPDRVYF